MDINTYIFGFSIIIFVAGFVTVFLTSREFKKMSEGKFEGGKEGGPRAILFDKLFDYLSDKDVVPSESMRVEKERIMRIVKEVEEDS